MTLAWPLVVLAGLILAWHRVGRALAIWKGREEVRAIQAERRLDVREAHTAVLRKLREEVAELREKHTAMDCRVMDRFALESKRVAALEEWHQRTLNRNRGRE